MSGAASISALWRELEEVGFPSLERIRFREGGRIGDVTILVGLDGLGHRHVCIPAPENDLGMCDQYSRGVSIEVRELLAGPEARPFVDVRCSIPALNELFSVVAGEMLETLARDASRPFSACHGVLERWRELLERERTPVLGQDQLAALLAELLVLEALVSRRGRAIEGWVGPEKAVHDFVCGSVDIEVKSSLRTTGRIVEIHDLAQLDPPAGGYLFLNFARLRYTPQRGRSVPTMVDSIGEKCSDRTLLFSRLARAGYDPAQRKEYEGITFEVTEQLWYQVDPRFPRITGTSFVGGAPAPAITKVSYTVDLDASPSRPLASGSDPLDSAAEVFAR